MLVMTILTLGAVAANPKESPAELAAWIDARLEAAWRAKGVQPREVVDDAVFLRRAYLELTGTIPSVAEARDFLDDKSADKRARLIQNLLDDKRFAEHTANLWARTLAPAGNTPDGLPTYPAAHADVLAVTAVGPDGRLAPYANMAPFVDVAMPGSSIVNLTGTPYFMTGTSVATARATGAVAGLSLLHGQSLAEALAVIRRTRGVQPASP